MQVLQSIGFGRIDIDQDGRLDVFFAHQKMFDSKKLKRMTNINYSCSSFLDSKLFKTQFKKLYFQNENTKAFKFKCFKVSNTGFATQVSEQVIQ